MKTYIHSKILLQTLAVLLLFSCTPGTTEKQAEKITFNSGECYFLPDSISFGHGLVLIPGDTTEPERWFLAPVFLDSASTGLDKFRKGNLQLQPNYNPKISREEYFAVASLQPQNAGQMKETLSHFQLVGTLKLKDEYRHGASGRAFANSSDVKNILYGWQRFYKRFKKTDVAQVFE